VKEFRLRPMFSGFIEWVFIVAVTMTITIGSALAVGIVVWEIVK